MSSHTLLLTAAMTAINTTGFASAVEDELCEKFLDSELDEEFCRNGGSIGGVVICSLAIHEYDPGSEKITGSFEIGFHESYYNGCRDLSWRLPWLGNGSFTISRDTGTMEIEIVAERLPEDEDVDGK